jgi:type II secretory pathway component PulF
MPQFRYVARNAEGKLIDGVVDCNDRATAIRQVEQQRCVPIKIEPVAGADSSKGAKGKTSPAAASKALSKSTSRSDSTKPVPAGPVETMTHSQQYLFTEQLAHLLSSGMTLDEALGILTKRMKHPKLHGLSQSLHQALVDGRSLSQALRDYPRIFSPLYVNMVAAGEASGALPDILKRLVMYLADVKALRDRVQQALIYPALLVVAGIGLIIIFMTVMVPQLMGFFQQTNSPLPLPTRILLEINRLLTGYWWIGVLVAFGASTGWKMFTRTAEGRKTWDAFLWRVPLYSWVIRYRFYAQFARTLGTLMQNGVTLLRALELLEEISGNEWVRLKMVDVRRAVVDGATLSTALNEQNIFPELFIDMMSVGEQTGRFGETMQNIADVYERELDKQVKIISALIPPMIMLVIAMVVGFVVYGILSAVFGMTNALRAGVR